jgi:hypothetical protein
LCENHLTAKPAPRKTNTILIQDKDGWLLFQNPAQIIQVNRIEVIVKTMSDAGILFSKSRIENGEELL